MSKAKTVKAAEDEGLLDLGEAVAPTETKTTVTSSPNDRPRTSFVVRESRQVPLSSICVAPDDVVAEDDPDVTAMVESLKLYGQLQPILLDEAGTVVFGRKRLAAAGKLGWETIRAEVQGGLRRGGLEQALVENLVRQAPNPLNLARGYQALLAEKIFPSQAALAKALGVSHTQVGLTLDLLEASPAAKKALKEGKKTKGQVQQEVKAQREATGGPGAREKRAEAPKKQEKVDEDEPRPSSLDLRLAGEKVSGRKPHSQYIPAPDLPKGLAVLVTKDSLRFEVTLDLRDEAGLVPDEDLQAAVLAVVKATKFPYVRAAANEVRTKVLCCLPEKE